jgi:DNA invertase Pin-like site-specific DNA recombinase
MEAALTGRGIGLVMLSIGSERLDSCTARGRRILAILAGAAEIARERRRECAARGSVRIGRPVSIDAAQVRQLRATLGPAAIARRLGSRAPRSTGARGT